MASPAYPRSSWLDPRVVVGGSAIDGRGLFAGWPIRSGELVAVIGGEVIDAAALARVADGGCPYSSITVADGRPLLLARLIRSGSATTAAPRTCGWPVPPAWSPAGASRRGRS